LVSRRKYYRRCFAAVTALNLTNPYDVHCRAQAVQAFKKLPEASALSIANKRVSNILAQYRTTIQLSKVDETLFEKPQEKNLWQKISKQEKNAYNSRERPTI